MRDARLTDRRVCYSRVREIAPAIIGNIRAGRLLASRLNVTTSRDYFIKIVGVYKRYFARGNGVKRVKTPKRKGVEKDNTERTMAR